MALQDFLNRPGRERKQVMPEDRIPTKNDSDNDLRNGVRGSLTQPTAPLAGGEPIYALQDPPLATPSFRTPPGQATHE
jgi:hypothetical protein